MPGAAIIDIYTKIFDSAISYTPTFITALTFLVCGWVLLRVVRYVVHVVLLRTDWDRALERFVESAIIATLGLVLLFFTLYLAGVDTNTFYAVLGAAGLAVGLSLQHPLGNVMAGIMVLVFKPFRYGDTILTQGHEGTVHKIEILSTTIITPENQRVVVPNSLIAYSPLVNKTARDTKRLSFSYELPHDTSIASVRAAALEVLTKDTCVLSDPTPEIVLTAYTEKYQTAEVRVWVYTHDCHLQHAFQEQILEALKEKKILTLSQCEK
jgi:small conductance mechanosensitive channel